LLFGLVLPLLFVLKMSLVMAQDHQAWALQQQEQSQALIRQYKKEALYLKSKALAPFEIKGKSCVHQSNLNCSKPQESKQDTVTSQEGSDSKLYIFVSFSMPKKSLKALAVEAKKHKAVLVIRGLIENSFLETATFLKDLGESVVLDPLLFREYNVVVVPTFIEAYQAGYRKISGNITLVYALEKFKEGGKE
jgi:type-F conjugative transfer system pilin assembly protein TrbC